MAKIFSTFFRRRGSSIHNKRRKVAKVLCEREMLIVVVLDDVDRLSAPEIREIFKLVRITASFPNLVYIVCCDRLRVEQALGEETAGLSGRDYLEKIIQLPFQLPEVPSHLLAAELHKAIGDVLAGIENPGPVYEDEWPAIFKEIIHPLVRNMRDVRRYAITIRHTLEDLDGQVSRNDVLALEAVRIFLPDMFMRLPNAINALTIPGWFVYEKCEIRTALSAENPMAPFNDWFRSQMEGIFKATDENSTDVAGGVARAAIDRLFPAGEHFRDIESDKYHVPDIDTENEKERLYLRRVAHEHIFRLYLERVISPDLEGNHLAEHVISLMAGRDDLRSFVHSLKLPEWYGLVSKLELSGRKIKNNHRETLVIVLLERWSCIPYQLNDLIFLDTTRSKIQKIIGPTLDALTDSDEADAIVDHILNEPISLSAKLLLVEILRDRADSGTHIVSESALQGHENTLQTIIINAPTDALAEESDLMRVLYFAKGRASSSGHRFHTDGSVNELTIRVLLSSLREKAGSIILDGLPVSMLPELDWDSLVKLYGDARLLEQRIRDLESAIDDLKPSIERRVPYDDFQSLLELADQHLEKGWPDETEASS